MSDNMAIEELEKQLQILKQAQLKEIEEKLAELNIRK